MKKLLKLAAVGLAAVLTAVSLSACGADTAKLSLVKEGTLIMGTNATQTVILKADSTIATLDDLKGKKIGVQSGTTGKDKAEEVTDAAKVTQYNNGSLAVEALVSGQIDAVIIDKNPAMAYKDQHGDAVKLLEGLFDEEEYALAVKKGNKELLDAINQALKDIKADGTFDKIVEKYIPSK